MTCPPCEQAAPFPAHRGHAPSRLVGPVRYARASYLCRRCGKGLFPVDQQAGLSARNLTPGRERVATRAGTVADRFEKGADLLHALAGVRLGESTVERPSEDAGPRVAEQLQAGQTLGPQVVGPWHKDYPGRRGAYVARDATGVRQPGDGGQAAEGRLAYVGMVGNPTPAWSWPDEKLPPRPARSVCGRYPLEAVGPRRRRQAAPVGRAGAAGWLGRCDGGNGLDDRLEENFPLVISVSLDFCHPAEKRTGRGRRRPPTDAARAQEEARPWGRRLKEEGGALLGAVLRQGDWPPGRAGRAEAVEEGAGYLERNAHRTEYPEDLAQGGCLGSGAVESACKTVVGQRLKRAGMRWGEDGADALCHLRALYRGEKGQWEAFWNRAYTRN